MQFGMIGIIISHRGMKGRRIQSVERRRPDGRTKPGAVPGAMPGAMPGCAISGCTVSGRSKAPTPRHGHADGLQAANIWGWCPSHQTIHETGAARRTTRGAMRQDTAVSCHVTGCRVQTTWGRSRSAGQDMMATSSSGSSASATSGSRSGSMRPMPTNERPPKRDRQRSASGDGGGGGVGVGARNGAQTRTRHVYASGQGSGGARAQQCQPNPMLRLQPRLWLGSDTVRIQIGPCPRPGRWQGSIGPQFALCRHGADMSRGAKKVREEARRASKRARSR